MPILNLDLNIRHDLNIVLRIIIRPPRSLRELHIGRVVLGPRILARPTYGRVVARAGGAATVLGGEGARKEARHEGAEEGQAGADYADVGFDGGPGCCGGVVVGWV
jgi:hypothetical protein